MSEILRHLHINPCKIQDKLPSWTNLQEFWSINSKLAEVDMAPSTPTPLNEPPHHTLPCAVKLSGARRTDKGFAPCEAERWTKKYVPIYLVLLLRNQTTLCSWCASFFTPISVFISTSISMNAYASFYMYIDILTFKLLYLHIVLTSKNHKNIIATRIDDLWIMLSLSFRSLYWHQLTCIVNEPRNPLKEHDISK